MTATRDPRIDFFRGLALLMIFINHVPGNAFSAFTIANLQLSDAAEVFVFLAGFSAVIAYGKIMERDGFWSSALAVAARVKALYVTHLILFLMVTAITVWAAGRFGDPMYLEDMALDSFVSDTSDAILHVLTLTYLPNFLDVLPLYIVLLAFVPALLLLFRLHPLAPLAVSALVYGLSRVFDLNLPNYPETREWFFNPAAWQLLFVAGATAGHQAARGGLALPFPRLVTLAAALYAGFAFLAMAPWTDLPGFASATLIPAQWLPPVDKTNLSLLRFANVLAQAWLAAVLVQRTSPFFETSVARLVVAAGRHSLDVFSLGLVLSVASAVALKQSGYAMPVQVAVTVLGLATLLAYGHCLEWHAGRRGGAAALKLGTAGARAAR